MFVRVIAHMETDFYAVSVKKANIKTCIPIVFWKSGSQSVIVHWVQNDDSSPWFPWFSNGSKFCRKAGTGSSDLCFIGSYRCSSIPVLYVAALQYGCIDYYNTSRYYQFHTDCLNAKGADTKELPNPNITILMGLPGDTVDGFKSTLDYCSALDIHVNCFELKVFPGTCFFDNASSFDLKYDADNGMNVLSSFSFSEDDLNSMRDLLSSYIKSGSRFCRVDKENATVHMGNSEKLQRE